MASSQRIWIITGISSGLGKALAKEVMRSDDFVIGTFRKQEQVDFFNQHYSSKGRAYKLDISQLEEIDQFIKEVASAYTNVDVLVNNAGLGFVGAVEETNIQEVRKVFEVNFFGALKLTQSVLPLMRQQKSGRIIQISSHGGIKAFAGFGIYNASKFALEGFSEAMAQEVASLGIKVSIVEPGPFRTNFAGAGLGQAKNIIEDYNDTAGAFRTMLKSVHTKQEGSPEKAAKAIFSLSKDENPPLRMPLGKVAMKTIGLKVKSVLEDLERGKETAETAVF